MDEGEYVALDTMFAADTALQWLGDATEEAEPPRRISSCRVDSTGMARVLAPAPDDLEESWNSLVSGTNEPVQFERDGDSVFCLVRCIYGRANRRNSTHLGLGDGC